MSDHIHKRHNKSLLLYHLVCPIKYRRSILSDLVEVSLVEVCINIEKRFEIKFLEIGSRIMFIFYYKVFMLSVKKIVQTIKSITAKELFRRSKQQLWGGQFWSSGYYVNTVGQYANEEVIQNYISTQGNDRKEYKSYHKSQLSLFG